MRGNVSMQDLTLWCVCRYSHCDRHGSKVKMDATNYEIPPFQRKPVLTPPERARWYLEANDLLFAVFAGSHVHYSPC